jgi:hypothetical protein
MIALCLGDLRVPDRALKPDNSKGIQELMAEPIKLEIFTDYV